mgnify:FL=1
MTYHAKLIKGGKIVIPAELRRELGFEAGDALVIESNGKELVIKSTSQALSDIQAKVKRLIKVPFTVDDFIAEKRAEAARE